MSRDMSSRHMTSNANPRNGQHETAQGASCSVAPVDLAHLRRYTLGDQRLEFEILGLFIEQAPLTIAAMARADCDRDWTRAAHTLKGSARAVGAWRLAKLAERAERLGGTSDRSACQRLVRQLEQGAAEARAYITSLAEIS